MSDNDDRDDQTSHVQRLIPLPPDEVVLAPKGHSEHSSVLRAIFSHPVFDICFPLSAACLLGIWFSNGDMAIMIPALAFGWVMAVVAWWSVKEVPRIWRIIWIVISSVVLGGAAGFVYWHAHPAALSLANSEAPPPIEAKVLIQCINGPLPSIVPASGGYSVIMLLSNNFRHLLGFVPETRVFSLYPPGTPWKPAGDTVLTAYRCEVTNYENMALFRVRVDLRFKFMKAVPEGGQSAGMTSGATILDGIFPYTIPRVDPGPNNPYVFYIWNMADDEFAEVGLPTDVIATRLGDENPIRIRLIIADQEDIWFGLAMKPKLDAPAPRALPGRRDSGSINAPSINIGSGNRQSGSHNEQDIQVQTH